MTAIDFVVRSVRVCASDRGVVCGSPNEWCCHLEHAPQFAM